MQTRALGYKRDSRDTRDHDALHAIKTPTAPPSVDRMAIWTKTLNQGQLGSCTCQATFQAVRSDELQQKVTAGETIISAQASTPFGSRLFGYYLARAVDHTTQEDAGAQIRNVFKGLNTHGFPPEDAWPYSDDSNPATGAFARMPSSDAFRLADDQKSSAAKMLANVVKYSRIQATAASRVDAVKRANADGKLVVFGTNVTEAFCSSDDPNPGGRPLDPPSAKDAIAGGHAMLWGGYNANGPWTLNSWGDDFADGGWFQMTWDYVAWAQTSDLWIVERAPLLAA